MLRHIKITISFATILINISLICQANSQSWSDWIDAYGSSSAFTAYDKTSEYHPIGREQFEAIIHNRLNSYLELEEPLAQFNVMSNFDSTLPILNTITRVPLKMPQSFDERSKQILFQIDRLVINSSSNELLIISTGSAHAMQFFVADLTTSFSDSKGKNLIYAAQKRNADTLLFSKEFFEFKQFLLTNKLLVPKEGDRVSSDEIYAYKEGIRFSWISGNETSSYLFSLIPFRKMISEADIKYDDFISDKDEKDQTPNVIIFMDNHILNSPGVFTNMPHPDVLKSDKIDKIKIYFEGFAAGEKLSTDVIKKRCDYGAQVIDKLSGEPALKNDPKWMEIMKSGKIIIRPSMAQLLEKARIYSKSGIEVEYYGLGGEHKF